MSNQTVILRIPGNGPGAGPTLSAPLPSLGVEDWAYRFDGARLDGTAPAPYTAWRGVGASAPVLTFSKGVGSATVNTVSGEKYLTLDWTSGAALELLGPDVPVGSTVAMLVRVPNKASGILATASGLNVRREADGQWSVRGGTSGTILSGTDFTDGVTGWRSIIVTTGDTANLRWNSTEKTGAVVRSADRKLRLQLGATTTDVEFAMVAVWHRELNVTERAAVQAAFGTASALI